MTDGAFPAGWALMKPQQTIEPAEFERLWAQGILIPTRKRDGNRAHIVTAGDNTRIYSRNGTLDWTDRVPHIARAFAAAPTGFILDVELHTDEEGTTSFQNAMNNCPDEIVWSAFDILRTDGSLNNEPYHYRSTIRDQVETKMGQAHWGGGVFFPLHSENLTYDQVLARIEKEKIEGLVMWDATAPHLVNTNGNTKRGRSWKIKIRQTEDLVVMGTNACADPSLGCGTLKLARMVNDVLVPIKAPVGSFEVTFDRRAALTRQGRYVVEVAHYGEDDNGNLVFPKIIRTRDDLLVDFKLAA